MILLNNDFLIINGHSIKFDIKYTSKTDIDILNENCYAFIYKIKNNFYFLFNSASKESLCSISDLAVLNKAHIFFLRFAFSADNSEILAFFKASDS